MEGIILLSQRRIGGNLELLVQFGHLGEPRWVSRRTVEMSGGPEAAAEMCAMVEHHLNKPENRTIFDIDEAEDEYFAPLNPRSRQQKRKGFIRKKSKAVEPAGVASAEARPLLPPLPRPVEFRAVTENNPVNSSGQLQAVNQSDRKEDTLPEKSGASAILKFLSKTKPRK
jgi:hypothetical protein